MIKHPAHSARSLGQDDVDEHMCKQASTQHLQHYYYTAYWMKEILDRAGDSEFVFLISISHSGFLPTNCQQTSVYRVAECFHACEHRRTRSSCLTSLEKRDFFPPQFGSSFRVCSWQQNNTTSKMQVWVFLYVVEICMCSLFHPYCGHWIKKLLQEA